MGVSALKRSEKKKPLERKETRKGKKRTCPDKKEKEKNI